MSKQLPEDGYVKRESKQCLVCGGIHQHDCGILISQRLKEIKPNGPNGEVITGHGLCEEHTKLRDSGYIALVEIIPPPEGTQQVELEDMERTGRYLHISERLARNLMDIPDDEKVPYLACVDKEGYNEILKVYKEQFPDST